MTCDSQFNVHGSVHLKNIPIYIQQNATLHKSFYLETALHVSGGVTTHHQESKQLLCSSNSSTIAAGGSNGVWIRDAVDTVVCAPDDVWWYHPKHVEQFPDKTNCVTLHLVGYILEHDSQFIIFNSTKKFVTRNFELLGVYYPRIITRLLGNKFTRAWYVSLLDTPKIA